MSTTNPKVDAVLEKATMWREETRKLRRIILDCHLAEELKWGKPCYTLDGKNIVLIQAFKSYFALLFIKGVLLKDPKGALVRIGQNTQAGRQMRFTSVREIEQMEPIVKSYIKEAIEVEKAGLEVQYKKPSEFKMPVELKSKLKEIPAFKKAFEALTPGRQRGYLLYFSSAKQSGTRTSRVEKCIPQILKGKGLND